MEYDIAKNKVDILEIDSSHFKMTAFPKGILLSNGRLHIVGGSNNVG